MGGRDWGEGKEGKLWSRCNIGKKNKKCFLKKLSSSLFDFVSQFLSTFMLSGV